MKKYISILKETKIFSGVEEEDITTMLQCLQAKCHSYKKGDYVIRQGEPISHIMILVEGKLHIQKDDYWGNRSIINLIEVGEMFGEAYVSPDSEAMRYDVVAVEDSVVLFLDVNRMLRVCTSTCRFHSQVVQNLVFSIGERNRKLVQKLGYITERTTREKLMSYLSDEAKRHNSETFFIPFNRQQLADFLSVDRSAMSNELCKMRDEGLLAFRKNQFTLF